MKIYEVDFEGMYPVGNTLIIAAENDEEAKKIAEKTVTHTKVDSIKQVDITKPCVIIYLDGNY